jgi:hypothetical protein
MSERELKRIGVLSEVIDERRSMASAAAVLSVSARHIRRLLAVCGQTGLEQVGR